MEKNSEPFDLSYIAGFLDGEGCFATASKYVRK